MMTTSLDLLRTDARLHTILAAICGSDRASRRYARCSTAASVSGIGTDGSNCSDHQNMFEAMRLAAFVSRIQGTPSEQWLGAGDVAKMALAGSAKAMQLTAPRTQAREGRSGGHRFPRPRQSEFRAFQQSA